MSLQKSSLKPQVELAVGTGPVSVRLNDMDGDGRVDIVTANDTSSDVSILLNEGGGSFATPLSYDLGASPCSLAVADLNTDGMPDIVTGNHGADHISVLLGTETTNYDEPVIYDWDPWSSTPLSTRVYVGDLNLDGHLDLVSASIQEYSNAHMDCWHGQGDGTFDRCGLAYYGTAAALSDVTMDGRLDVIAADVFDGSVEVFVNREQLGVEDAAFYDVGDRPTSVLLDKIDADPFPDIVTANSSSDDISILLGTGSRQFAAPVTYAVGDQPEALAKGDLDGDGFTDLVTANYGSGNISVLLGQSDGTLADQMTYPVGANPLSLALGDVNGDDRQDVIVANSTDDNVSVLPGNGDGTLGLPSTFAVGSKPVCVELGDIDGDGVLDIVTANRGSDDLSVLFGTGTGAFASQMVLETGSRPNAVRLGDLDNDGDLDISVANGGISSDVDTQNIAVLLQDANGGFTDLQTYTLWHPPKTLELQDVDFDGDLDLVTTEWLGDDIVVFRGRGDGTFPDPEWRISAGEYPCAVALGDITGNGDFGLVAAARDADEVALIYRKSGSTFTAETEKHVTTDSVDAIAVGDLNGDGFMDVVTENDYTNSQYGVYGGVSVLLGMENGSFQQHRWYQAGKNPASVDQGDVDGDGCLDIVTANAGGEDVSVLLGLGDGTFVQHVTYPAGSGPRKVLLSDIDGDGDLDIVTENLESNLYGTEREYALSVLIGQGDGTFGAPTSYLTDTSFVQSIKVGDFTGDDRTDILAITDYNIVALLAGIGDGTFADPVEIPVASYLSSLDVGDFNGDGWLDFAALRDGNGEWDVSVLLGLGNGAFATPVVYELDRHPGTDVFVLDLNADSNEDIVIQDGQVFFGYGDGTFSAPRQYSSVAPGVPMTWADIDGNNFPDLLRAADGNVEVLRSQGRPVVTHNPTVAVSGKLNRVTFVFASAMDTESFSVADDVVSFSGPDGPLEVTGDRWLNDCVLEVTFEPQYRSGVYEMTIGPNVLDADGSPLDVDGDGAAGEIPDDRYAATFVIDAPRVVDQKPTGSLAGPVDSLRLYFDRPMDTSSFMLNDVLSFTSPKGPVSVTGFAWLDSQTLDVQFPAQTTVGDYELIVDPDVHDRYQNPLDQDQDFIPGESSDDRYVARFDVAAPKVLSHTPSTSPLPIDRIRFQFDHAMDSASFDWAEDVVSFTAPEGPVSVDGFRWLDSRTLELTFPIQKAYGTLEMVLGSNILDLAGNALDQDGDGVPGEIGDDRYSAAITCTLSGNVTADATIGGPGEVFVFEGSLTVADSASLTVEAGTILKFNYSASLVVNGKLDVRGTNDQPVIFTSIADNTVGGDANGGDDAAPYAGIWQGLRVGTDGQASLQGVEIRYASRALDANSTRAKVDLRNTVLRDGVVGVYVYTPLAEVTAQNCLIADNAKTGVFVRADSRHSFKNCTIVGNGYEGSGRDGAGIHLGGSMLTLENCIVAFNNAGLHHSDDPPTAIVRNSIFHNPAGQEISWDGDAGMPDLSANGNLTTDPLFIDHEDGNYELANGSPAIDSGTGIHAPATDILGRTRHDDRGMPNAGNGYPCYVDMGAFERQEDSAMADLAITHISDFYPDVVSVGDTLDLEWIVQNVGTVDIAGTWQDLVYLSDDPYLGGDQLLAAVDHTDGLAAGDSYTESIAATVPASPGPKYLLVHTKLEKAGDQQEATQTNNLGVSAGVLAVDVPLLELGTPIDAATGSGQWNYYRFEGEPGRTVLFTLDGEAGSAALYIRRTLPPTLSDHNTAGTIVNQASQELRLLEPIADTYYVGVFQNTLGGGSRSYTLSATLTTLDIRQVTPDQVGSAGTATIQISGDAFDPGAVVQLVGPDASIIEGEEYYQDSATLFATFDLGDVTAADGSYDVVVVNPDFEFVTKFGAVVVSTGGGGGFEAGLSMQSLARPGRIIPVVINYSNTGTTDLASPLLTMTGPADCEWQAPGNDEWVSAPEFRLMALSTSGPTNLLRPGQSESIEIKVRTPFSSAEMEIRLFSLGAHPGGRSEESVPWSSWYDDEDTVADLEARFGLTWSDYVSALGKMAAIAQPWKGLLFEPEELEFYALISSEMASAVNLRLLQSASATEEAQAQDSVSYNEPGTVYVWNSGEFKVATVGEDGVNPGYPTTVIIHGMDNSIDTDWVADMAEAVREAEGDDHNVLAVGWGRWSGKFSPLTGANNAPLVAEIVEDRLFSSIEDSGLNLDPALTHLIGHSHGAHVAALVAKASDQQVKRITALDTSEETSHAWSRNNLWGVGWEFDSAGFVDSYKSSVLFGGETAWGDDNFLLVEEGHVWSIWEGPFGTHGYAHEWYLSTIKEPGKVPLDLGYNWKSGSWDAACKQIDGLTAQIGPWKGLIRGETDGSHVVECFSEAIGEAEQWDYPGAWSGGFDDSDAIKNMLYSLAAAVDMDVISTLSAEPEDGNNTWKAGGKGTVSYGIGNRADNQSISKKMRKNAQMGDNMGLLGPSGPGPIQDVFWLSKNEELDPTEDYPLGNLWHEDDQFLATANEAGSIQSFELELNLPGKNHAWWGSDALPGTYYIIVDAGATKTQPYEGELDPTNNVYWCEITVEGEDLSADAGTYGERIDEDGDGWELVTLDGSGSAPLFDITSYEWSVEGNEVTVSHVFPIGTHNVTLTVFDRYGNSDSDETTIVVSPRQALPDGDPEDSDRTRFRTSHTPEDKFGPAGYDSPSVTEGIEVRYVNQDQAFDYRIEFWNKKDAEVPTQDAIIVDPIDPGVFDLSTVELTRIGFLDWDVALPGGQVVDTRIDCRPEMNIVVEVRAGYELAIPGFTGDVEGAYVWWLHCVDPETGEYPEDPMAGFLPPFNPETSYELGWVEFSVDLLDGLPGGTTIENQALVEFDFVGDLLDHPAPKEGPWVNTLDVAAPASAVEPLPATRQEANFLVRWSGSDAAGEAGINSYSIYVSVDDGPATLWLESATDGSAVYGGELGHTYRFYSIATDNVGHKESIPASADAQTTIVLPNQAPTDILLSTAAASEGAVAGTPVGNLSTVDGDAGDTHTYVLLNDADGRFHITGNELQVANGALLDYESATSHIVRIRTTDAGGLVFDKDLAITVTDVNEGPTAITLSENSVAENAASGTAIGTLVTTDPDTGDSFSYALVDDADGRFEIVSNELQVADVNEAPTAIALSENRIAENAPSGTVIGTLATTDPDSGDSFSYALVDDADGRFQIVGDELQVADGTLLDYETATSHGVRIRTTDAGGLVFDKNFMIDVTNVVEVHDLGPIDFRLLEGLSLTSGSLFYCVETSQDGLLSLQVDTPVPPKSARFMLYDADPVETTGLVPLARSTLNDDSHQRLDWAVAAGETYYVEVYGYNPEFDVRLVNLVSQLDDTVTVQGTAGNDWFEFDPLVARDVTVNGVVYHFDEAEVSSVEFIGDDGADVIVLSDSAGNESLEAWPDRVVLTNAPDDTIADFAVSATGIEYLSAYGHRGGEDTAVLHGSEGGDKLKSYEDSVRVRATGNRYALRAKLFDSVVAYSGSSGNDLAVFNRSNESQVFTYSGTENSARMESTGRNHLAQGFNRIVARAGGGDEDAAHFTDSDENDVVYFRSHKTVLVNSEVKITVRAFDEVHATADADGFDVARLYDTPGDDHLEVSDDTVRFYRRIGAELDLLYEAIGFERAKVYSTDGDDTKDVQDHTLDLLLYGWAE